MKLLCNLVEILNLLLKISFFLRLLNESLILSLLLGLNLRETLFGSVKLLAQWMQLALLKLNQLQGLSQLCFKFILFLLISSNIVGKCALLSSEIILKLLDLHFEFFAQNNLWSLLFLNVLVQLVHMLLFFCHLLHDLLLACIQLVFQFKFLYFVLSQLLLLERQTVVQLLIFLAKRGDLLLKGIYLISEFVNLIFVMSDLLSKNLFFRDFFLFFLHKLLKLTLFDGKLVIKSCNFLVWCIL